jgi:phenylalanyl-tRNA synthetase beta chain
MKFTLSWLKDHLETDASLDDILYALTDLGLEVEGVENPAERLADFTIGKVVHAEKHPDADKLRVCQVETDAGKTQIICGAPNARAGITGCCCKTWCLCARVLIRPSVLAKSVASKAMA